MSRARSRGYSLIEVMVGMAVLAVGASGVVALQKVTVLGVNTGRNINSATAIAAAHVEAVRADAIRWNSRNDYADAALLNALLPAANVGGGVWQMPVAGIIPADPGFGRSDVAGATEVGTVGRPPIAYCTQMRLTQVAFDPAQPPAPPVTAQASDAILLRLEVRTFWAKSGRDVDEECLVGNVAQIDAALTAGTMTIGGIARSVDEYGWVFLATSIRRNDIAMVN